MDAYQKELENEDHKYVENVIMKPIKIYIETNTTPSNWSIHTRESTERKIPTLKRLPWKCWS